MRNKNYACFFFLIFILFSLSSASDTNKDYNNFICYFAGIEILKADKISTPSEKAYIYKVLCDITGVNAKKAKDFIKRYYNKPEEWKKITAKVVELIQKSK
jgi:hypothetical protein